MEKEVYLKIVRSDGKTFLADGTGQVGEDWGLTDISGIDAAEYETFTEDKAVGYGSVVTGKRIGARDIGFTAVCKGYKSDVLRRAAISFFSLLYSYSIYITYRGKTCWIEGELAAKPAISSKNIYNKVTATVDFICPDALFKSVDEFGKDIAGITPMWPSEEIYTADGSPYDFYNFAKTIDISNDGDAECYATVSIEATAEVVNPKIYNDRAYIRLIDTLRPGDVVIIDIANRSVTKNGANILGKVDRASDFDALAFTPGDNQIAFSADSGENAMHVYLYYNTLWLGV